MTLTREPLNGSVDDTDLLAAVQESTKRLSDIVMVNPGAIFLTAKAYDHVTEKKVLLTIARPGDADARRQLAVLRQMMTTISDERIGTVIERLWQRRTDDAWACLVSTLHPNLLSLHDALLAEGEGVPTLEILRLVRSLCRQLNIIHAAGYAHGDVSMGNVGIDVRGVLHLIDFEHIVSAANLDRQRTGATSGYTHPAKLASVSSGASASLDDHQRWDMYGVGRTILSILDAAYPHRFPELTPRAQRAIRLIGCLLLGAAGESADTALGLPPSFLADHRFVGLSDAVAALDRVTGRTRLDMTIPELDYTRESVMRISSSTGVPFTRRMKDIINTPELRRINDFQQLGLISFIWPTATHRRFEHAIGTFGMTCAVVRSLLADPQNPLFAVLVTPRLVRTVLLAALLHDVGHFPLAHDLEEAYFSAFDHERRSIHLVTRGGLAEAIARPEPDGWGVDPSDVASIIAGRPLSGSKLSPGLCGMFHSLISGPIDSDKLDYLRRDSEKLFVRAGQGMDVGRVVSSLTIALVPDRNGDRVLRMAVRSKGRRPAELVGRVRSHMFGVAYWHHSYRSIKAMIHWMVWSCVDAAVRGGAQPDQAAKRLAKQLHADIDRSYGPTTVPMTVVPAPLTLGQRGALPIAEAFVLDWLAENGGLDTGEMVALLRAHRWYKSILTVDHYANESEFERGHFEQTVSAALWQGLERLSAQHDSKRWALRMRMARETQRNIVEWLAPQTQGNAGTVVFDFARNKDRFIAAASGRPLLLIDAPDPTRAFQEPLYHTRVERRVSMGIDPTEPIAAVRSYDSRRLAEEFVISNGHIRLLCHPDFDEFVERAVARSTLIELLARAFDTSIA